MAKPGRPPKSTSFAAKRWLYALCEFDKARQAGEKHSAALHTAAAEMLRKHPHLKISETEIKRMLAQLRRRPRGLVLFCSEMRP